MSRYTGTQLILAKCAVVILIALVSGPQPAAVLALFILGYEVLSRGLAIVLGRFWPSRADEPSEPLAAAETFRGGPTPVWALLAYLGGQAVVWIIVAIIAASRAGIPAGQAELLKELAGLVPLAMPGSLLASGVALILVLRAWRKRIGPAALATMLGLSWGTWRQLAKGVLAGAALALLVLPLVASMSNRPEPPDLTTQLAMSSKSALRSWMFSAVFLAPPIEELMFRGAFLGGLAQTRSVRAAALISGATFWMMHGPEFVHWPAAVSIGLLTILATSLRLRTGILGPSIAAHFGYNLMIATMISFAMFYRPPESKWARVNRHGSVLHDQVSAAAHQSGRSVKIGSSAGQRKRAGMLVVPTPRDT